MKLLPFEIWKDIPGYEGLYQASTMGRIRSLNYKRTGKVKILTQYTYNGYKSLNLHKGKQQKSEWVHRLVAKTWLPNPYNYPQINHKDENPSNNAVSNLEWCSPKHNANWGTRNIRTAITQRNNADTNKQYKKTYQYTKDGILVNVWVSANDAAKNLGISSSNIVRCCNNVPRYKTAGGFIWKYDED